MKKISSAFISSAIIVSSITSLLVNASNTEKTML